GDQADMKDWPRRWSANQSPSHGISVRRVCSPRPMLSLLLQTGCPKETPAMLFTSLFRRLRRGSERNQDGRPRRPRTHRQPRPFVPGLEVLEARTVPSTTRTVRNDHDSGSGSLRGTIAAADPGDQIVFAKSVRAIALTSGQLVINKNLDIEGPGAQQLTISGNTASRVFDIQGGATVTLAGLTVANGAAGSPGSSGVGD